ncbi:hypothetical protein CB577_24795 [Salmonella enterica subsp. enterica serovar Enteritidis]|jgi:hypothetical protein|nr:hypothetical protein [Salmonella enterica subsp. enterica serovar Enteritidis]
MIKKLFTKVSLEHHAMKELFTRNIGDGREKTLCKIIKGSGGQSLEHASWHDYLAHLFIGRLKFGVRKIQSSLIPFKLCR